MTAYIVVEHIITDAAKFEEYRAKVGPMIAKQGGRYLKGWKPQDARGRPLEARARRGHRVSGHGFLERLVQLGRISAAHRAS